MKEQKIEHLAIAKELYDNPNFIVNKITKSEWTKFINTRCSSIYESLLVYYFRPLRSKIS
jgi:hypothetical protein